MDPSASRAGAASKGRLCRCAYHVYRRQDLRRPKALKLPLPVLVVQGTDAKAYLLVELKWPRFTLVSFNGAAEAHQSHDEQSEVGVHIVSTPHAARVSYGGQEITLHRLAETMTALVRSEDALLAFESLCQECAKAPAARASRVRAPRAPPRVPSPVRDGAVGDASSSGEPARMPRSPGGHITDGVLQMLRKNRYVQLQQGATTTHEPQLLRVNRRIEGSSGILPVYECVFALPSGGKQLVHATAPLLTPNPRHLAILEEFQRANDLLDA